MKNTINVKNYIIALFSIILILSLLAFALRPVSATEVEPKTMESVTFTMSEGAAISLVEGNQKNGLKFIAKMSASDYEGIMANTDYSNIQFGMFIVPEEYTAVYDLTIANLFGDSENEAVYGWATFDGEEWQYEGDKIQIMNIYADEMVEKENGFVHEGTISNIKDYNIARNFVGRGYIKYTENSVVKYKLADYYDGAVANNTRSIAYVAQMAIADTSAAAPTSDEKTWMTNNYINKSVVDYTAEDYAYVDLSDTADYVFAVDGDAVRVTTEDYSIVPFTAGENTITLANTLVKQVLAKGENTVYFHTRKVVIDQYVFEVKKLTLVVADMVLDNDNDFASFVTELKNSASVLYADKLVVLSNDIDLTNSSNLGTGSDLNQSATVGFGGMFDGRNHTIYGGNYGQSGMFKGITATGVVKNLNIVAPTIKWGYSGVIAGTVAGTLENINVVMNAKQSTSNAALSEASAYAYKTTSTARYTKCSIYCFDLPDGYTTGSKSLGFAVIQSFQFVGTDPNCNVLYSQTADNVWHDSRSYSRPFTTVSISGQTTIESITIKKWSNTANALVDVTTSLTDLVADGSQVSLVNGLGVKVDSGVTVQNGKIILDSNNISAETFGGNTFFIEIASANGNLYIPAILA